MRMESDHNERFFVLGLSGTDVGNQAGLVLWVAAPAPRWPGRPPGAAPVGSLAAFSTKVPSQDPEPASEGGGPGYIAMDASLEAPS